MTTSLPSVDTARPSSSGNTRRRRLLAGVSALLLGTGLLGPVGPLVSPAAASPLPQVPWVPDAPVSAVAVGPDGTQYLGGGFEQMALATGGGARVDVSGGQVHRATATVIGTVYAVALDGSGGEYIGGDFTQVGTQARANLAHIRADGSVDPDWAPVADDTVYAIAVASGTVYVGGSFTEAGASAGPVTRNGLAAFDAVTGALTPWNPDLWLDGNYHAGMAKALAVAPSGVVYVGGVFDMVNVTANWSSSSPSVYRYNAAAFDADGDVTAWDPVAVDSNSSWLTQVRALAICGSTVYLGGRFDAVNYVLDQQSWIASWEPRNNLAAVNMTDGAAAAWDPNVNGPVNAIAIDDCGGVNEGVIVGGAFTQVNDSNTIGPLPRINIARFEGVGGSRSGWVSTSWVPAVGGEVFGIALAGDFVAVVGDFTEVTGWNGSHDRNYAAMFEKNGYYFVEAWNPNLSLLSNNADPVAYAIATVGYIPSFGGWLYIGGAFDAANGVERSHLAALDNNAGASGDLTSWDPQVDGEVYTLSISGSDLYVGGDFNQVGSDTRHNLARVALSTGAVDSWNPNLDDDVYALAVDGTTTYAGGGFSSVGSDTRNHLAALDSGGAVTTWDPDLDDDVSGLATDSTTLYAGGAFSTVGGSVTRNRLAAFDRADGTLTGWNPNLDDDVYALAVDGTTLFAGGVFTAVAGSHPRSNLVSFDLANDGLCTAWAPTLGGGGQYGSYVGTLAADGTQVFVGGRFSTANGANHAGLALFDATNGSVDGWDPGLIARTGAGFTEVEVYALAHATVSNVSTLYVGGQFAGSADVPTARYYLRMTPTPQGGGSPSTATACGGGSGGGGSGGGGGGGSSSTPATTSPVAPIPAPTAAPTVIAPVDTTGTPTVTPVVAGPAKTQVGFVSGSSALSRAAKARLDALVKRVKKDARTGARTVTIVGASATSRALAKQRAETVAAYLRARGLTGMYAVTGKVGSTGRQFTSVTVGSRA